MDNSKEFTLEDILEEQRRLREAQQAAPPAPQAPKSPPTQEPEGETPPTPAPAPDPREALAWEEDFEETPEIPVEEAPPPPAQESPQKEPPQGTKRAVSQGRKGPPSQEGGASTAPSQEEEADLTAYAQPSPPGKNRPEPPREGPEEKSGKKKKKKNGLFGRKKRMPDFDDGEDMYYGVQLKPIDEYRRGFDPATGEFTLVGDGTFTSLFDDREIDQEVEKNFETLQRERRRRVAQAVQTAGVDEDQIADEFGIVAPMPVTAFAADPYAKQHGIGVDEKSVGEEGLGEIQKAMLETSTDKTMEIKLNVLNDTVEIQRVKELPVVSEDTVTKILNSAEELQQETRQEQAREEEEQADSALAGETVVVEELPQQASQALETTEAAQETVMLPPMRELGKIPQVASIYEYRERTIPTHVINADLLQSALLSESAQMGSPGGEGELGDEKAAPMFRRRIRAKKPQVLLPEDEPEDTRAPGESIDDYTGPADAKPIASELKGDMRELTLRMMLTGVCTVLLMLTNLFFGGMATVYVILNIIFLGISVGVCYRTIGNGLRSLLAFAANSDSAAAVAALAVVLQTLSSLFFSTDLTEGKLHLYGVVLSAILFVNAAGKLTMIRRIHSNFRFVTSREQKYGVQLYDDYNTALKMTKNTVSEKPAIAYQSKAGFLKRFLEHSYSSDPAEAASQLLAPVGLISSLVLCIATLLITRSVPGALSAFAAACCACVAAGNMLAVNLPMSRLCRSARRAGGMVVGYEAVKRFGTVNAVMVDAEEIFPLGTVVLNGIRTFVGRAQSEDAIMAASALMREIGGPLCGVFEQVINENEESLPKVAHVFFEEEHGATGTVDGRKIYIGNRALLVNHQIEPPTREEEMQYASGNKQVVYIATEDGIAAMLVVTYSADRRRKNELQRLEDSGISVLVHTTDVNVTPQLLSRLFGIDASTVGVLEGHLGDVSQELMRTQVDRADALVATKGRMESMLSVISACVSEKRNVSLIVAIQNAAVILGFVLVAFLACFGGMNQLSSLILFLFEAFWLAVLVLLPKMRKP